jgi:hypothetical protein
MVKKFFVLSFIFVFLLVACQSAATSPTADQPDQGSEAETVTDPPPLPEVSPTPAAENVEVQGEANCTVVSRQPTPGPTEQSLVPPVDAADWAHGPEDAKVTIIEYGDFQ